MEKELSAKDSRFKLGEEFKEDIQVKPDMSIQAKMKVNHDLEVVMSYESYDMIDVPSIHIRSISSIRFFPDSSARVMAK